MNTSVRKSIVKQHEHICSICDCEYTCDCTSSYRLPCPICELKNIRNGTTNRQFKTEEEMENYIKYTFIPHMKNHIIFISIDNKNLWDKIIVASEL